MSETTDEAMQNMLNGKTKETEAQATDETKTEEPAQETQTEIDWTAEARKWEARAKANRKEADELKPLAEKVSELEQQLEEAKTAASQTEAAVGKKDAEIVRWRIAAKYGVSEDDVELFLTGSDEETLEKQAQRLSSTSANAPKPDPRQAKREVGTPSNADAFAAALEGLL